MYHPLHALPSPCPPPHFHHRALRPRHRSGPPSRRFRHMDQFLVRRCFFRQRARRVRTLALPHHPHILPSPRVARRPRHRARASSLRSQPSRLTLLWPCVHDGCCPRHHALEGDRARHAFGPTSKPRHLLRCPHRVRLLRRDYIHMYGCRSALRFSHRALPRPARHHPTRPHLLGLRLQPRRAHHHHLPRMRRGL